MIRDAEDREIFPFFRGRGALYHALKALGIGPGDRVAIQAFTCLAVPLPIRELGATPLFIDADPHTLGMSVDDLRRKIGAKTRAVVVQHTFGIPADIRALQEVAESAGAVLIEDCAHVVGGTTEEQGLGSIGVAAFYSYEWGKPVVAGVGGGLVVNDPALVDRVRDATRPLTRPPFRQSVVLEVQYLAYRWVLTGWTYWGVRKLYNLLSRTGFLVGTFRREDLEGAENEEYRWGMAPGTRRRLGARLKDAGRVAEHNRRLTAAYEMALKGAGVPQWPAIAERDAILMRYPFLVTDKDRILELARRERVELSGTFKTVVDPVPGDEAGWLEYHEGDCPEAERLAGSVISAPVATRVSLRQVRRTVQFLAKHRELLLPPTSAGGETPTRSKRKGGEVHDRT